MQISFTNTELFCGYNSKLNTVTNNIRLTKTLLETSINFPPFDRLSTSRLAVKEGRTSGLFLKNKSHKSLHTSGG